MDLWILLVLAIAGVAGTVEVHFENKDGGFFLKHTPRQFYPAVADLAGSSTNPPPRPVNTAAALSVDTFTVLQTSQPISIRATYGPFSTKQTVPARYIVPDPLDSLPLPDKPSHGPNQTLLDMDMLSAHHLDMSAHIVRGEVPRDSPVLRVLFHTGSEPGARRLSHHQKVCIVLHATMGDRPTLTSACSPDGEDGVCLAQVTIPWTWWSPLPPPDYGKPVKTPQRYVQVAYSVLEPRPGGDCLPRVQIQPVTPLAAVPLVQARSAYRELRTDELLTMLVPHGPLYPLSRLHIPVFLQSRADYPVSVFVIRARVKSGLRLLGADASTDQWNVSVDLNPKHTVATVTAFRKESAEQKTPLRVEEVFSWLLEVVEDSSDLWDGGRIVWNVRYVLEGPDNARQHRTALHRASSLRSARGAAHEGAEKPVTQRRAARDASLEETRRKLTARLEIQKDDIQSVLPISKNWDLINTAVLTGRQVSQAMKVFIVSQAGKVADVTLQSSCHSEDESVLKVSSSCSSVYVDGSEMRGSSNASVLVKYGTYTGLAKFTVWMPEFPLEVNVADFRLSQVKGWKVPEDHVSGAKMKRSISEVEKSRPASYRGWNGHGSLEEGNGVDGDRHSNCRIRFQQSPVEVYARFLATDHDSGRVSYFVNRRTWLRVTDLVLSLLRVSDPRIASLHGRILQGRSMGRTEVQVLSHITGKVIGAKEVRVGNDKVSVTRLQVRVVSGLQLSIVPDSGIDNGYIAETSVSRKLTAQYQEGLLDIDLDFSDGSRTPLREVSVADYRLLVDSLDPDVVAFAPMVASHHPRVIAVGEGRGDLLRVALLLSEDCRNAPRRKGALTKGSNAGPLAAASAYVDVDFNAGEVPRRPDFVQNDGGGNVGHPGRDRKSNRELSPDLQDILIGIPLKDENNHEPTVQARQHHSAVANGVGMRRPSVHMTPLEICMYVLLAAFCFAIVVFVASCVVYASKFKPQTVESPGASPGGGLGAAMGGAISLGKSHHQPRESTTNAHDWVWLGRATLERASNSSGHFNNNNKEEQEMHITDNPLREVGDDQQQMLATCFDNPHHIDLPSRTAAIDSSTYCKKDKLPRPYCGPPVSPARHRTQQHGEPAQDKLWKITPPPPPPHGLPLEEGTPDTAEYRPPVPPHRNVGVTARIGPSRQQPGPVAGFAQQPPRRHHHHHHHHRNGGKSSAKPPDQERHHHAKRQPSREEQDPAFVEPSNGAQRHGGSSPEVKRATIVGNPMFSATEDDVEEDFRGQQELLGIEDLNLDMDYDQIMEYFDNLKESNA